MCERKSTENQLTLPDLRGSRANPPKIRFQNEILIEVRFQNEILANLTSIKNTQSDIIKFGI